MTQAGKSKEKTTEVDAIESVQVEVFGSYGTDGKIDREQLNKNLKNINGLTINGQVLSDTNKIDNLPATVKLDGYNIVIDEKGNVAKKVTIVDAKSNGTIFSDNTTIEDEYGNPITIPAGFRVAEDSASNVTGGVVIEDATYAGRRGSQFVWIPVGKVFTKTDRSEFKTIELNRYEFSADGTPIPRGESVIGESFQELESSDYGNIVAKDVQAFINETNNSHGYYIGRYEARRSSEGYFTVVGNDPVLSATQAEGARLSRIMYDDSLPFTSDLMNSYAWDTAIVFAQEFDDRTTGNTKKYSMQNSLNSGSRASTGTNNLEDTTKQDRICNIWDMSSNCEEWTTETYHNPYSDSCCTSRGGYFLSPSDGYTSKRFCAAQYTVAFVMNSFRPILYL